jgi:hypothetical protein
MSQRYQLNEKDIDKTLNYLKSHYPDIARPEIAIEVLEIMYVLAHKTAVHRQELNFDSAIEQAIKQVMKTDD